MQKCFIISLERFSALLTSEKMFKYGNSMNGEDGKEANKVTGEDTENKGRGNRNCKTI